MKEGLLLLNLSSNQLLSDKLSEFCGLPQLEVLDLSFNLFLFTDGNLSPDLSSFPRLRIFNLSHNHLSGSVPSDLSQLSELEILDLSYNDLSGKVPSSLGSLQSLAQLVLSHNHLSGSVPASFRQNVEIYIDGNPDLINHTVIKNQPHKRRAHNFVVVIIL